MEGDYLRDEAVSGFKEIIGISPRLNVYTISNLDPNKYYEVELLAINNMGDSNPMPFIFKTKQGMSLFFYIVLLVSGKSFESGNKLYEVPCFH